MKTSIASKNLKLAVAFALAAGFASTAVRAQKFPPAAERELWNDTAKQVWRNGYGECWHSAFGPPPAFGECNPAPLAQYVAPVPVPYVAPAPAPAVVQYVEPARVQPEPVAVPAELPRKRDRN